MALSEVETLTAAPVSDDKLYPSTQGKLGYRPDYVRVEHSQMHFTRRKALLKLHPEINDLQGVERWSALWVVAITVFQTALAYYFSSAPWWWLALLGYTVGASACHAIYLNETYNDPDIPSPLEARIFGGTAIGKAVWLLGFPLFQGIRVLRYNQEGLFEKWLISNFIIQGIYTGLICHFFGLKAVFYLIFSSYFALSLHPLGARWVAEHYAFAPDQETYSYYGPANRIAFNIGYHNEHHDLPRVPWSRLPKVKSVAPEFYDGLAHHTSYTEVLFRFLFDSNFTLKSRVVRWPRKKE